VYQLLSDFKNLAMFFLAGPGWFLAQIISQQLTEYDSHNFYFQFVYCQCYTTVGAHNDISLSRVLV